MTGKMLLRLIVAGLLAASLPSPAMAGHGGGGLQAGNGSAGGYNHQGKQGQLYQDQRQERMQIRDPSRHGNSSMEPTGERDQLRQRDRIRDPSLHTDQDRDRTRERDRTRDRIQETQ
jgi:hypothetical protein